MICKYAEIFCWKNVSSFCNAKATHIFSAKNIRILYIESAKTVNEITLNELVKLTTLWATGPRTFMVTTIYIVGYDKRNLHFCVFHLGLWLFTAYPVSIPHKSIAGRYRPVRVPDGPITARYRFMKNASWVESRNLFAKKTNVPQHSYLENGGQINETRCIIDFTLPQWCTYARLT